MVAPVRAVGTKGWDEGWETGWRETARLVGMREALGGVAGASEGDLRVLGRRARAGVQGTEGPWRWWRGVRGTLRTGSSLPVPCPQRMVVEQAARIPGPPDLRVQCLQQTHSSHEVRPLWLPSPWPPAGLLRDTVPGRDPLGTQGSPRTVGACPLLSHGGGNAGWAWLLVSSLAPSPVRLPSDLPVACGAVGCGSPATYQVGFVHNRCPPEGPCPVARWGV